MQKERTTFPRKEGTPVCKKNSKFAVIVLFIGMQSPLSYIEEKLEGLQLLGVAESDNICDADTLVNRYYKSLKDHKSADIQNLYDAACVYIYIPGRLQEAKRYFRRFIEGSQDSDRMDRARTAIEVIDSICMFYSENLMTSYEPSNQVELNAALDIVHCIWEQRMFDYGENNYNVSYTLDGIYNEGKKNWFEMTDRVVFLLKDQNQGGKIGAPRWDDDLRKWKLSGKGHFFPNIRRILWGIHSPFKYSKDEVCGNKAVAQEITEFVSSQPFAMVECKKQPGYKTVSDKTIEEHLERYGDLLNEEIRLLKPHYLICTSQQIYEFALKMYNGTDDSDPLHQGRCYDAKTGTLIIHAFHPSDPNQCIQDHYWMVRKQLDDLK